MIMIMISHLS